MAKKKQVNIIIVVLALIFLAIFINQTFTLASFSISNINIIGGGDKIRIFASIGGGEELDVVFGSSNSDFESELNEEGFKSTQSSRLKAEFIESSKQFNFFTGNSNLVKRINAFPSGSVLVVNPFANPINRCITNGFPNTVAVTLTSPLTTACWEYSLFGNMNSFTGGETGGFSVKFDLDGETAILSGNSPSITLAGGDVKIDWGGNLLTINDVNAPNSQVYHLENSWQLVDNNAFSSINSAFNTFSANCGQTIISVSDLSSCLSSYENALFQNLASQDDEYVNIESNVNNINFNNGVMFVDLGQPTFRPTFIIDLRASRVGIVELVGEPVIVSCIQDQDFNTAGSRSASASIKNNGDQEGFFNFVISCDNPQMSGGAGGLDFNAGQTRTVNFQLAGGNTGEDLNEATCTLTVTDSNSGELDSCQFGFDVEFDPVTGECVNEDTKCSPDASVLFTCVDGQFQPSACTPQVCVLVGTTHQCVDDGDDDDTGPLPNCQSCDDFALSKILTSVFGEDSEIGFVQDNQCNPKLKHNNTLCSLSFIKLALVPLSLIFTYLIMLQLLTRFPSLRNRNTRIITAGIISIIVAYLIFITFFIGLIIFLGVFLWRLTIGGQIKAFRRGLQR